MYGAKTYLNVFSNTLFEQMMSEARVNKRLSRLVESHIRKAENASKYSDELKYLAEQIADKSSARKRSKFFKSLADETRLRILKLLEVKEMCVCEIMIALDLTQPTASHHLGILENTGLIKERKEGKWAFYSLTNPEVGKYLTL